MVVCQLLDFQKEIDFVTGQSQCAGYESGRFAATLHAQRLSASRQIQWLSRQAGDIGCFRIRP